MSVPRMFALIIVFCEFFVAILGTCTLGSYECIPILKYNNVLQWATCLTDVYIKIKSKRIHQCEDQTATRCWYQCMCEMNNKCNGPEVYRNCSCDTNTPTTTTLSPQTTLPQWCSSPDGKTCSWYQECLEKRYPCEGTGAKYAITYAEKFCELYTEHYPSFSHDGQTWIDAVRKCLQVELVPILRPWVEKTCSEIKTLALASHTKCYTSPSMGTSFCSLGIRDKWQIFWTIKGAFVKAPTSSMLGLWDILLECIKQNHESFDLENDIAVTRVFVKKLTGMEKDPNIYAGKIVDSIAVLQRWASKELAWFGYHEEKNDRRRRSIVQNEESKFRIIIMLFPKRSFDLNGYNASEVNMTEIVSLLSNFVERGRTGITVNGVSTDILSMTVCGDIVCNSTILDVVARVLPTTIETPKPNRAPKVTGTIGKLSGTLLVIVGILSFRSNGP